MQSPASLANAGPYIISPQQPQGMMGGGPMLGPPQGAYMGPPQSAMMMGGGMAAGPGLGAGPGPGGWLPQMPITNSSMPELAPFQPPSQNINGMPSLAGDFMGNYGGSGGLPVGAGLQVGGMESSKDPRRARQSRWGAQADPGSQQIAQSPPELYGGGGPGASPKYQPLSLREKRKNLQYDSPLSR